MTMHEQSKDIKSSDRHMHVSMMCHRHGPQESPGTEVLKKRFLFAECYVCQTACCFLQCSAQDSIAMSATFDTVAA